MYANPKDVRTEVVKMRMTEDEKKLLEAISLFRREQPAKLAYELVMKALEDYKKQNNI